MKSSFRILFYLKSRSIRPSGKVLIMGRITIDGKGIQFSTKLDVKPELWDTKAGKATGKSKESLEVNNLLDELKGSLHKVFHELKRNDIQVTAEKVKNDFLGITIQHHTLLSLFAKHNEDCFSLIGVSKTKATYQKYEVSRKHVQSFLKTKYNLSDISLKEINHMFICDFEIYLMTTCKCGSNTTAKFMQFFKRIILIAKNNGWITTDPFANYKIRLKRVDRGYLTQEEIGKIMKKSFPIKRLEQVRDIFIFSCFCGIAYIDVKKLRAENIRTSFDGNLWIMGKREKTDVSFNIPLLEIPQKILNKYKGTHPKNMILPVPSNQKMNAYLKEIGDLCGIDKDLTFHLARHTFATLTLSKGVSIESVSKMLGHTNIRTTQIYAKITDAKIGNDMAEFAGKLKGIEGTFNLCVIDSPSLAAI